MDMSIIDRRTMVVRAELTSAKQWTKESVSLITKAGKTTGAQRNVLLDEARAADRKASEAIARLESAIEDINEVRHFIRVAIASSREVE